MIKQITERCDKSDKPTNIKVILLCVEAITGVIGSALILNQDHPYFALGTLAVGAAVSKIINFYKWNINV